MNSLRAPGPLCHENILSNCKREGCNEFVCVCTWLFKLRISELCFWPTWKQTNEWVVVTIHLPKCERSTNSASFRVLPCITEWEGAPASKSSLITTSYLHILHKNVAQKPLSYLHTARISNPYCSGFSKSMTTWRIMRPAFLRHSLKGLSIFFFSIFLAAVIRVSVVPVNAELSNNSS